MKQQKVPSGNYEFIYILMGMMRSFSLCVLAYLFPIEGLHMCVCVCLVCALNVYQVNSKIDDE